jgi:GNAT superfamily N-acetyltransferase
MRTLSQIAFQPVRDPVGRDMDDLLAIYQEAIPARERKPAAELRAMAVSPCQHLLLARDGDAAVGFLVMFLGKRARLLEYMAVEPRRRGLGLGAALFRRAQAAAGPRPLLVEVEAERDPAPGADLRRRRIDFYRRLGCRRIAGLDYILPLPGDGAPPAMDLLVTGIDANLLTRPLLATWLAEIYAGVYRLGPEDPRLEAMISALPDASWLD